MKIFRNLLDNVKPHFEEGGKLEKYFYAFEGIETLLFVSEHTTHKGSHIRDGIDLKRTMFTVVIALIPALLFGIWNVGHQHFLALGEAAAFMDKFLYGSVLVLPIIAVSYGVGLGIEFAFAIGRGHPVNEGFLVSGMLIPLVLPPTIPLWMVAVATAFAVVIGKEAFGGTGMNLLNPALTARAFLFFAYPTKMSGDAVWISVDPSLAVDGFSGATPLGLALENGVESLNSMQHVSYDFMNMLIGAIPGSIGETSVIAIAIGAAILLFTGIASWRIMAGVLIGTLGMTFLMNAIGANPYMTVPVHLQLVMGGMLFATVFMTTDPVTGGQTLQGKWIYGISIGILGMLIRVLNPAYPEGWMLAILLMNVFAPTIDHIIVQKNIKRRVSRA